MFVTKAKFDELQDQLANLQKELNSKKAELEAYKRPAQDIYTVMYAVEYKHGDSIQRIDRAFACSSLARAKETVQNLRKSGVVDLLLAIDGTIEAPVFFTLNLNSESIVFVDCWVEKKSAE